MRIGVFATIYQKSPFEEMLDRVVAAGVTAVEIGSGGLVGHPHCPVDELLESESRRKAYKQAVDCAWPDHQRLQLPRQPGASQPGVGAGIRRPTSASRCAWRSSWRCRWSSPSPAARAVRRRTRSATGSPVRGRLSSPQALKYQWDEVTIPYWVEMNKFAEAHGVKLALEMHPGMLVYNVETMLRLHRAAGKAIGCNFDPSHLFWNGVDPVAAIRALGDVIYHVHGKDVYVDPAERQGQRLQRQQAVRAAG